MSFLKNRIKSFGYAFKGLADLFRSQPNARIHGVATLFAIGLGWLLAISTTEWCLVLISITMVISAEAFNTALEYLTDLVSPDFNPLAGKTKDVAAAGVLLTAINAAIIGTIIYVPKLLEYLAKLNN